MKKNRENKETEREREGGKKTQIQMLKNDDYMKNKPEEERRNIKEMRHEQWEMTIQ